MNNFILAWLIISVIVILIWLVLILSKTLHLNLHHRDAEVKRIKRGAPSYSIPEYVRQPSAIEYYGFYSPTKAGISTELKRDELTEKEQDKLPHCPECGAAIGFAAKQCPNCGLKLASE